MSGFFDPHIHMYSRTTDDYDAMSKAGIEVIVQPSFWLGGPRTFVGTFTGNISYRSKLQELNNLELNILYVFL